MIKEYRQFNTSIKEYNSMSPAYLEVYSRSMVADVHFRFVTFEKDDYRRRRLTCILYNYIPDSVFFSVENALETEQALDELIALNPGVEWYLVTVNYDQLGADSQAGITIELSISKIPVRVNANGELVSK